MKVKENVKKGMIVLGIYLIITFCLLLSTERIQRLDTSNLRNNNGSVSLSFNK